ncbi:DNA primase [Apilactobacillus xinyiensis]|uniref:DNA primase n=1 Tax=Apilactobacillus xinyiensis TaxID=2841032 RepID=UPI0020103B58|nr:DNA primase [Apilactobacillus xinyiensis]MCL0318196.1 DNA primase [Apilactobacillus xinyiensis]
MIPEEVIENVRNQTNILDVISSFVQLKKSGSNYFGLCPFQAEKTPSFSVSEDKQIFHCFSCGRGGNVFKFLMDLQGISFPDSVVKVADMQGIQLSDKYLENNNNHVNSPNRNLISLHEDAKKLYHHILINTEMGEQALEYLKNRGLSDDTIEHYQLGFAPQQKILEEFFKQKKISYDLLRKSGLFIEDADGNLKDRFFDRIMFPITDTNGSVVAFSGRVFDQNNQAKYLNSPETEIFNKRKVLFNFSNAKDEIRKQHSVILFEGFMDVISAFQSNVKNGIASMGTSLTKEQIYQIKRHTKNLYICYDGDIPGQNAIDRALKLLQGSQLDLGVIKMPKGIDPDEYRKQYGEDKFFNYVDSAKESPVSFEMQYLKLNRNLDNEKDLTSYISDVLKVVAKMSKPIEREIYLNQLTEQFNIDKNILIKQLDEIDAFEPTNSVTTSTNRESLSKLVNNKRLISKVENAERMLLYRMLHDHNIWIQIMGIDGFNFVHEKYQMLFLLAQGYFAEHDEFNISEFTDFIKEDNLQKLMIDIEVSNVLGTSSVKEIDDYVNIIMNQAPIDIKLKSKKDEFKEATRLGDIDRQTQLAIEIIKLKKKQQLIDKD